MYSSIGHVGLGHLRLAVIDLSSNGHQPMCYTHGGRTAVMVYNGEVYNFAELRDELEGKGYAFRSRSDTEVMLAAYLEFGVDCVTRFNGMFAFVIYDVERDILFGARDRFGEKPFKYYLDDQRMVFSSELKAVLATGVPRELDLDAVDDFLTLQDVPQPAYRLPEDPQASARALLRARHRQPVDADHTVLRPGRLRRSSSCPNPTGWTGSTMRCIAPWSGD